MGYWPSVRSRWLDIGQVLLLRVFIKSQKEKKGAEQTWSIKDLSVIWLSGKCCLRDTTGSSEPARVANHSTRFRSPCPLAELAI